MGEQEDDDEVEDRRQAEREGEALHVAGGEVVQDRRGEERHGVGRQDRAPRPHPGPRDGDAHRSALVHLVLYSFEEHDERVGGDTDRDDEAGDAGQASG